MREAQIQRTTAETDISLRLSIDGTGKSDIHTGIGFFDHMLVLLSKHALMDLSIECNGDIHVDGHHTVEDIGIVLGKAFAQALGDKRGIARYASEFVPMDEALAHVSVDISARPVLVYRVPPMPPMVGQLDTQLVEEFLRAFCTNAAITLHVAVEYGNNAHHMIEGIFKALGRALRMAAALDARNAGQIPSSKGCLEF